MDRPLVAHFKDAFLPASETFIYPQVSRLKRYDSIVLDRHERQNSYLFPIARYYSVAENRGRWYARAERLALWYFGRSPSLEQVLKQHQVRIIHAHFGQLGALITPVATRLRLPLVVSFYGKDLSTFVDSARWEHRFQLLWYGAHTVIALGMRMVRELENAGCPPDKVTMLPTAIDLNRFQYRERKPPDAQSPVRLLGLGRLVEKKGFDVALRALATLAGDLDFCLTIAGEGPQRERLETLAAELNIAERIRFPGWLDRDQVVAEMGKAHLFLLPSRTDRRTGETEGTPTVLLEAQASGLPVISTLHAGIPDIVQHGQSGWLVPEDDPQALAAQLRTICTQTTDWPAYSWRARQYVKRRHSQEVVIARLEEIYDSCLERT